MRCYVWEETWYMIGNYYELRQEDDVFEQHRSSYKLFKIEADKSTYFQIYLFILFDQISKSEL